MYNDRDREEAFKYYVSELIRGLGNAYSGSLGGQEIFPMSWNDVENYKPETRSADEIKSGMLDKLKKLGGEE